ncbi:MAG: nucleotide exchange factor GrpE, partial [Planctomycetes bacterium]|nr:nucleotide exchange factor GrpE [Planctomycetota bacterium]
QKQMNDLEAVRREHYKQTLVLESTEKVLQAAHEELVKFFEAMQKVLIDRKQIDEERTQARQKASEFQKQMDAWVEAVVAFLKVLERNFDAQSGTTPEHRKALEYVLNTFLRTISPLGFSVIRPEADQDFVGTIHHADGEELSPTIKPGHVIRGVSWGYSFNGRVVERAHVIVAKQEKKPEPAPAPTPTPPEPSKDGKKDEPAQDQKKDEKPKEERKDTPQPMPAAKPEDKKAPETKPNSAPAPQGKK